MLAARIIVAIENPEDLVVVSSRQFGQRAVFKFAQYTGAQYVGGRYTPGTFTNQIQRNFLEPRVLLVTDPNTDSQPIMEAGYVNLPVIALCNTDADTEGIDVVIPCNNNSKFSLALMYYLLAREVLRMRGVISRSEPWSVMVDLFMYRDPEAATETPEEPVVVPEETAETTDFGALSQPAKVAEWGADEVPAATNYQAAQNWGGDAAAAPAAAAAAPAAGNWNAAAAPAADWAQTSGF